MAGEIWQPSNARDNRNTVAVPGRERRPLQGGRLPLGRSSHLIHQRIQPVVGIVWMRFLPGLIELAEERRRRNLTAKYRADLVAGRHRSFLQQQVASSHLG